IMIRACVILALISLVSLVRSQCSGGIPSAEVKGFIDAHNELRQTIAAGNYVAKGKNMPASQFPIPDLNWDCEIEKSAQAVADTCVMEHSNTNLGENLYDASSSDKGIGHATQVFRPRAHSKVDRQFEMAWAATTKIGCGMTACQDGKEVMVACQYS
ncbi:hypothetical protein PENTCL1PPCAC_30107, partial [Pristionchus entomophagus]